MKQLTIMYSTDGVVSFFIHLNLIIYRLQQRNKFGNFLYKKINDVEVFRIYEIIDKRRQTDVFNSEREKLKIFEETIVKK